MASPALWLQIVNIGEFLGAFLHHGDVPMPVFHHYLEPVPTQSGTGVAGLPRTVSWETKAGIKAGISLSRSGRGNWVIGQGMFTDAHFFLFLI